MFETLESIPWDQLRQAHGDAHQVPEALRGLMSKSIHGYWKSSTLENNDSGENK